MIGKSVVLALAGMSLPVSAAPGPRYIKSGFVHRVDCDGARGTAFQVGRNTMLSVSHVTTNENCRVLGRPLVKLFENGNDFSAMRSPRLGGFPISCEGFVRGETYIALGYAHGGNRVRYMEVVATDLPGWRGFTTLYGNEKFIPGMSGGAVIRKSTGAVVGTVNAYSVQLPFSYSRSLSETPLCRPAS